MREFNWLTMCDLIDIKKEILSKLHLVWKYRLCQVVANMCVVCGNCIQLSCYVMLCLFSERELTFAICCRPSVCRLTVVCNARAPYSGGWNFRQYFYGIRYIGHPLTSTENFTEIVPGNPSAGGVKDKRGSQVYRFRTYRRLYLGNSAR